MDGVLSQEEINALLNNNDAADSSDEILTESEKDAIGEIANIPHIRQLVRKSDHLNLNWCCLKPFYGCTFSFHPGLGFIFAFL